MGPLDHLGITAEELYRRVDDEIWLRWQHAEPALQTLTTLEELRELRGPAADRRLGALVRLAAVDGGNDRLAAVAVAHQLAGEARGIAISLRDLSSDIDALVMSTLWVEICQFPWQRRTHAFATGVLRSTRRSVLHQLIGTPFERRRVLSAAPETLAELRLPQAADHLEDLLEHRSAAEELAEFLTWCATRGRARSEDTALVVELLAAARTNGDAVTPNARPGVCSLDTVRVVAERRGVSVKSMIRERDRALARLRRAASAYLNDVA
jgi:hypothetical protein